MAVLPGYRRAPGTSRGYISPTGQRLSRRQYDKVVAAAGLKQSMAPQRYAIQVRAQRVYNRLVNALARLKRAVLGEKAPGKAALRQSAEMKQIKRDIRAATKRKPGQPLSPENAVKLRDALKRAGLRDNVPDWVPPGLSDAYKKGKVSRSRDVKRHGRAALPGGQLRRKGKGKGAGIRTARGH